MNKYLLILVFICSYSLLQAQAPQSVCYQAVATTQTGSALVNQNVGLRISIIKNNPNGVVVYAETHQKPTDGFGLFTLDIGTGTPAIGTFSAIEWGKDKYYMKVEMDASGGGNYTLMGINLIQSVPYALYSDRSSKSDTASYAIHAQTSDTSVYATHSHTSDTANVANFALISQTSIISDTSNYSSVSGTSLTSMDDADKSPTNELQTLVFANGQLSLSPAVSGSTPITVQDGDGDSTNELQSVTYSNGVLTLTPAPPNGMGTVTIQDGDGDPTNEIQQLTFNDSTGVLTINGNGGNSVNIRNGYFAAPGSSSDYPQGIIGEFKILTTGSYVVPANKTLYVTASSSEITINVNGTDYSHSIIPNMPILPGGTIIKDCMCTAFLVNPTTFLQPVVINLEQAGSFYQVPSNKVLVIKSGLSDGYIKIDPTGGVDYQLFQFYDGLYVRGVNHLVTIPQSARITKGINGAILTGYLLDVQ